MHWLSGSLHLISAQRTAPSFVSLFRSVGLNLSLARDFGQEVQFGAAEIVDAPLEERRTLRGGPFIPQRPVSAKIAIQILQGFASAPGHLFGG